MWGELRIVAVGGVSFTARVPALPRRQDRAVDCAASFRHTSLPPLPRWPGSVLARKRDTSRGAFQEICRWDMGCSTLGHDLPFATRGPMRLDAVVSSDQRP